jgi:hypothetical protein
MGGIVRHSTIHLAKQTKCLKIASRIVRGKVNWTVCSCEIQYGQPGSKCGDGIDGRTGSTGDHQGVCRQEKTPSLLFSAEFTDLGKVAVVEDWPAHCSDDDPVDGEAKTFYARRYHAEANIAADYRDVTTLKPRQAGRM